VLEAKRSLFTLIWSNLGREKVGNPAERCFQNDDGCWSMGQPWRIMARWHPAWIWHKSRAIQTVQDIPGISLAHVWKKNSRFALVSTTFHPKMATPKPPVTW
jgi:hypothetical protein